MARPLSKHLKLGTKSTNWPGSTARSGGQLLQWLPLLLIAASCSSDEGSGTADPEGSAGAAGGQAVDDPSTGGNGGHGATRSDGAGGSGGTRKTASGGMANTGGMNTGGTSSGGTAGAAGSVGNPSGGTGGGSTHPKLCEGEGVELLPNEGLLDDFEWNGSSFQSSFTSPPSEQEKASGKEKPTLTQDIVDAEDHGGRGYYSLHISTDQPLVGSGGGMLNYFGCTGVSAFSGLSFWAKGTTGTGEMTVGLAMKETDHPQCEEADICFDFPRKTISVSSEWKQYKVLFSSFEPPNPDVPPFYGYITGIYFLWDAGADVNLDVYLDDVEFYE